MAVVNVSVEPAYRRRGVLSALFAEVDSEVARRGRTKINAWVKYAHPPVPGREAGVLGGNGVTMPSEGDGAVPADDRASGFARSMGMDLWQVERVSRLDVESCAGAVAALGEAARLAAGEAYGVVGWVGAVPDWAVEGYCRMIEKMDTDTPAGGLEWDESVWDESRLRVSARRSGNPCGARSWSKPVPSTAPPAPRWPSRSWWWSVRFWKPSSRRTRSWSRRTGATDSACWSRPQTSTGFAGPGRPCAASTPGTRTKTGTCSPLTRTWDSGVFSARGPGRKKPKRIYRMCLPQKAEGLLILSYRQMILSSDVATRRPRRTCSPSRSGAMNSYGAFPQVAP